MSMTREKTQWHLEYESAKPIIKDAVDEAYTAARKVLEAKGFSVANDDTAENLVAAIMEYLVDSAEAGQF